MYVVPHPRLPGALFVVTHAGRIHLFEPGEVLQLALDLSASVVQSGESGMHGLVFHPHDASRAFVVYNPADASLVLEEVALDGDARTFLPDTRVERLRVPAAYGAHHGAAIAFGPDGYLYLSVGDGGAQDDPDDRAQDLASFHGKLLRIDVDMPGRGYAVPPSNPFVGGPRPEVYALGFRNPWRMSFDSSSGDLWLVDVGGYLSEEVNVLRAGEAGKNFGWRVFEGSILRQDADVGPTLAPVHEYRTGSGRCAIVGGVMMRTPISTIEGSYLFSDFCDGRIRALAQEDPGRWSARELLPSGGMVVHLALDHDGSLLVLRFDGTLLRLVADAPPIDATGQNA